MTITKKIYASMSGFLVGEAVHCTYNGPCLRNILALSNGLWDQIDPVYAQVGALNEEAYEKKIPPGLKYSRELPIRHPVAAVPDVDCSFRADFVFEDRVVELKSVVSENSASRTIGKSGKPKLDNLAQVTAYMVSLAKDKAELIYTQYKKSDELWKEHKSRTYNIAVDAEGFLRVDGLSSGYTVYDYIAHRNEAAKVVSTQTVGPRPNNAYARYGSPCTYCPWNKVCERFDEGRITSSGEFINECKKVLEAKRDKA